MTPTPSHGAPARPGVVVVPVPADAAGRAALTTRTAALSAVRHQHLVAVIEVEATSDGALDVVHARGEAADLPAVLAVRGRLAPAEAAAVGVHVAQALAALHAAGLLHGPLEPADVVLRPSGAPALRPRAAVPPEEWTTAEDVRAAARLVTGLLGSPPVTPAAPPPLAGDPVADPEGALRAALADALGPDARRRPEAGTFAALVDAACEPSPVRLPDPATLAGAALAGLWRDARQAGPSAPASARRRATRHGRGTRTVDGPTARGRAGALDRRRAAAELRKPRARVGMPWRRGLRAQPLSPRPVVVVVGIGLAVGVMTGAALELRDGGAWGAGGAEAPATAETPSTSDPTLDRRRPDAAAATLTQRRLDLLAGDFADVGGVDVPGSPAHAADTALLQRLRVSGVRPEQPHATVTNTTLVEADSRVATVRVRYIVDAHTQRARDGARTTVAATHSQTATLAMRWTDEGWRITTVA